MSGLPYQNEPIEVNALDNHLYFVDLATTIGDLAPGINTLLRIPEEGDSITITVETISNNISVDSTNIQVGNLILIKDTTSAYAITPKEAEIEQSLPTDTISAVPYFSTSVPAVTQVNIGTIAVPNLVNVNFQKVVPFPPNVPNANYDALFVSGNKFIINIGYPNRDTGDAPPRPPASIVPTLGLPLYDPEEPWSPTPAGTCDEIVCGKTGGVSPYNYYVGHPYRDETVIDINETYFGIYQVVDIQFDTPQTGTNSFVFQRTRPSLDMRPGTQIYVKGGVKNLNNILILDSQDCQFALGYTGNTPVPAPPNPLNGTYTVFNTNNVLIGDLNATPELDGVKVNDKIKVYGVVYKVLSVVARNLPEVARIVIDKVPQYSASNVVISKVPSDIQFLTVTADVDDPLIVNDLVVNNDVVMGTDDNSLICLGKQGLLSQDGSESTIIVKPYNILDLTNVTIVGPPPTVPNPTPNNVSNDGYVYTKFISGQIMGNAGATTNDGGLEIRTNADTINSPLTLSTVDGGFGTAGDFSIRSGQNTWIDVSSGLPLYVNYIKSTDGSTFDVFDGENCIINSLVIPAADLTLTSASGKQILLVSDTLVQAVGNFDVSGTLSVDTITHSGAGQVTYGASINMGNLNISNIQNLTTVTLNATNVGTNINMGGNNITNVGTLSVGTFSATTIDTQILTSSIGDLTLTTTTGNIRFTPGGVGKIIVSPAETFEGIGSTLVFTNGTISNFSSTTATIGTLIVTTSFSVTGTLKVGTLSGNTGSPLSIITDSVTVINAPVGNSMTIAPNGDLTLQPTNIGGVTHGAIDIISAGGVGFNGILIQSQGDDISIDPQGGDIDVNGSNIINVNSVVSASPITIQSLSGGNIILNPVGGGVVQSNTNIDLTTHSLINVVSITRAGLLTLQTTGANNIKLDSGANIDVDNNIITNISTLQSGTIVPLLISTQSGQDIDLTPDTNGDVAMTITGTGVIMMTTAGGNITLNPVGGSTQITNAVMQSNIDMGDFDIIGANDIIGTSGQQVTVKSSGGTGIVRLETVGNSNIELAPAGTGVISLSKDLDVGGNDINNFINLNGLASTDISLKTTTAGSVTISSFGATKPISLTTADGNITLTATGTTGANGKITMSSSNGQAITLNTASSIDFQVSSANFMTINSGGVTINAPAVGNGSHIISTQTTAPTTAFAGDTASATLSGTDMAGRVAMTTTAGGLAGTVTITFNSGYASIPVVTANSWENGGTHPTDVYIVSISTTAVVVGFTTPAGAGTAFGITYHVIGL